MKIKQTVTYSKTKEFIVDVLCNKCGLSCNNSKRKCEARGEEYRPRELPFHKWHRPLFSGLIEVEVSGEAESNIAFQDGDYYNFSLCHICIKELMQTFVIPAVYYNQFECTEAGMIVGEPDEE